MESNESSVDSDSASFANTFESSAFKLSLPTTNHAAFDAEGAKFRAEVHRETVL
jgi:hypothetical protein